MWASIITILIPIGFKVLEYFLQKSKTSLEMQELFLKFVEKISAEYKNSAEMRQRAADRLKLILEKEFTESK